MTLNDPIANALSLILNCEKVGKKECLLKNSSKLLVNLLSILRDKGYIGQYNLIKDGPKQYIKLNLVGNINKCGVIKPRFGVKRTGFEKFEKRFLPAKNFGFIIVSTSKGLMTHNEAKEKGFGGKLLAYCY
ncbi:MAG: 30S ribosomal protein S8 [Candidatus Woesearchaeota archaeon]|nr:MAG: 30S ribosomal protein S8 [Candidatus Woesearchaeota archaeon]